jgi:phage-related protein
MPEDTLNILILAKDQASSVFKNIGGNAKKAFKTISVAALAGGTAVAAGLGLALREAAMTEEIINELNQVIESTGGIAGVTSREAQDLAKSFQEVTKFSDEVVMRGETLLLTFTNINEDVFPRTVETMLNMGEAFGSVDGAAIQLGKALNDPVAGISALADVGVSFTQEQKDMVAAMMEAGDIMGAQTLILDELEKEFGGVARAAGEGLAGQLTILKNILQDVAVAIGNVALPAVTSFVSGVIAGVKALPEMVAEFKQLLDLTRTFGGEEGRFKILADSIGSSIPESVIRAVLSVENFANRVGKALDYANTIIQNTITHWGREGLEAVLRSLFKTWQGGATHVGAFLLILGVGANTAEKVGIAFNWLANALMDVLIPAFNLLKNTIIPFVVDHLPAILAAFAAIGALMAGAAIAGQIMAIVAALAALTNPIVWIAAAVALLAAAWVEDWGGIRSAITEDVWPAIQPILSKLWGWFQILLPIAVDTFKKDWKNMTKGIGKIVDFWNSSLKPFLKSLWTWMQILIPVAIAIVVKEWESFRNKISSIVDFWNNGFKPALSALWAYLQILIPAAVQSAKNKIIALKEQAFQAIADFLVGTVVPAFQSLRDTLTTIKTRVKLIGTQVKTIFLVAWQEVTEYITGTAQSAWDKLKDTFTALKTRVTLIGNQVKGVFLEAWTTATDYITNTAQTAWDTIKDTISMVRSKISAVATILTNAFLTAITTATNFIVETVQPAWTTWKTAINRAYNFLVNIGSLLEGTFLTALQTVQPLVDLLASGFDLLKGALQPIKDLLDGVADGFKWITENVPDWALPGSLPPLAQGFKDIGEQMSFANAKNKEFTRGMLNLHRLRGGVADISGFGENAASQRQQGRGTGRGPDLRNINYTLIVNSNASTEPIAQDFRFMQAWNRSI